MLWLTRPQVGLRPTNPHQAAGPRTEPPVSSPREVAHRKAAVAPPEPLLEPPVNRSRSQGLRAVSNAWDKLVVPNSVILSLLQENGPRRFQLGDHRGVFIGNNIVEMGVPQVVRMPAVLSWSLTATERRVKDPGIRPGQLPLRFPRGLHRLVAANGQVGVQPVVQAVNAPEVSFNDFHWGYLATLDKLRQLGYRQKRDVGFFNNGVSPALIRSLRLDVLMAGPWRTCNAARPDRWPSAVAGGWAKVRPYPARAGECGPDLPEGH